MILTTGDPLSAGTETSIILIAFWSTLLPTQLVVEWGRTVPLGRSKGSEACAILSAHLPVL
jgi:hypothetical protein